jgi:hypothetical protein
MCDQNELITRLHLLKEQALNPNDQRLKVYDAIQKAVSNITPWGMLTITTTTPIYDLIVFESLVRRFHSQVHRLVLGMRKSSRVPMLTILERNKKGVLHAHILIGDIQGSKREQEATTFKHFIQKQIFPSVVKVLGRLTYGAGKQSKLRLNEESCISTKLHDEQSKPEKTNIQKSHRKTSATRIGKIGMVDFKAVYEPVGLVDYLLKGMRIDNFYVAWLASDLSFQGSGDLVCPERPNHPESKMVQKHTQSKAPLKVP